MGLAALAVAACQPVEAPIGATPPPVRPADLGKTNDIERTDVSFDLEQYYARVESGLLVRGLLRQDGGGPDVPFDSDRLIQTFNEVVFQQEFVRRGDRLIRTNASSRLNRFERAVRVNVVFGQTLSDDDTASDRMEITRLLRRLERTTGRSVQETPDPTASNFTVFIVHEEERLQLADRLRAAMPELTDSDVSAILDMPRTRYCLVVTSDPADDGRLERAIAIIRAEHPARLRVSCLHEEIAQGFGLQNDSPTARPSIFTDEEEFGRLTEMDEFLLSMLYDPRLSPGMTAEEAQPILREIVADLLGTSV